MKGSITIKERLFLIKTLDNITFNSIWTKNKFLTGIPRIYHKINKLSIIVTSCPLSRNLLAAVLPIYPAPPVINIFIIIY